MKKTSDKLIKILSLGIGLAIGIVLIAKVCFELSYDSFYKDIDRLYLIDTHYEQQGEKQDFAQTSGAVAPGFKAEIPGVEEATRYTFHYSGNRYLDEDNNVINGSMVLADSCFFKVFDRPILAGDPAKVLAKPGCTMVSESFAKKLGGVSECIGKTIANEDDPQNRFVIEGVFEDFPANGNFHFDIIGSLEVLPAYTTDNWNGNDRYFGFVKLQKGFDYKSLGDAIRKMHLDPETSRGILTLLTEISRNGRAVLIATHDYSMIKEFPGRIIKCDHEQLVELKNDEVFDFSSIDK